MNSMENFITGDSSTLTRFSALIINLGYPGCEFQIRAALADVLGPAKSEFFFDKVLCRKLTSK